MNSTSDVPSIFITVRNKEGTKKRRVSIEDCNVDQVIRVMDFMYKTEFHSLLRCQHNWFTTARKMISLVEGQDMGRIITVFKWITGNWTIALKERFLVIATSMLSTQSQFQIYQEVCGFNETGHFIWKFRQS